MGNREFMTTGSYINYSPYTIELTFVPNMAVKVTYGKELTPIEAEDFLTQVLSKLHLSCKNKEISDGILNVIFNNPATIVYWKDGTKTVVKCQPCDEYSKEVGFAMCIIKKICGNKGNYNDLFEKWCK